MIIFDVKDMARSLMTLSGEHLVLREKVVVECLGYALEIFNHPHRRIAIIDDMIELFEYQQGVFGLDSFVVDTVNIMRAAADRYGWDVRMKGKFEFKEIGKGFHQARFVMDLDETMAWIFHKEMPKPEPTKVIDAVIDNPGADVINELSRLHTRQARRSTQVVPNLNPTFVREPEESGWRVGHWERFGENAVRRDRARALGEDD